MDKSIKKIRSRILIPTTILFSLYVLFSVLILDWLLLNPSTTFVISSGEDPALKLKSLDGKGYEVKKIIWKMPNYEFGKAIRSFLICDKLYANVCVKNEESGVVYFLLTDNCSISLQAITPTYDFSKNNISLISLLQGWDYYRLNVPTSTFKADEAANSLFERDIVQKLDVTYSRQSFFPDEDLHNLEQEKDNPIMNFFYQVYSKLPYEHSARWYNFRNWHSVIGLFLCYWEFVFLLFPAFISLAEHLIRLCQKKDIIKDNP